MAVLVTVATEHGATGEIATAIASTLREHGLEVVVLPPEEVRDFDLAEIRSATRGRDHRVFAGKLEKRNQTERWANSIARRLVISPRS